MRKLYNASAVPRKTRDTRAAKIKPWPTGIPLRLIFDLVQPIDSKEIYRTEAGEDLEGSSLPAVASVNCGTATSLLGRDESEANHPTLIDVQTRERIIIITARGELDQSAAPSLRQALETAVGGTWPMIVVDLSAVTFIDVAACDSFRATVDATTSRHKYFRLINPGSEVERVLRDTGLADYVVAVERLPTPVLPPELASPSSSSVNEDQWKPTRKTAAVSAASPGLMPG
jgi:anti-anti-sigma factor